MSVTPTLSAPSLRPVVRRPIPRADGAPSVPRLFPGETFVCLGGGPSLTQADVLATWGQAHAIAVNDAYRLAPWAVALMASDAKWWRYHEPRLEGFSGYRYCLEDTGGLPDSVTLLRNTGKDGLETDPTGLRTGGNSGAAAINLAVHFGAARILLLGYDMGADRRRAHWFGDHPPELKRARSPFHSFMARMATQVAPLRALGVEVLNCSRRTALECFPRVRLEDALG